MPRMVRKEISLGDVWYDLIENNLMLRIWWVAISFTIKSTQSDDGWPIGRQRNLRMRKRGTYGAPVLQRTSGSDFARKWYRVYFYLLQEEEVHRKIFTLNGFIRPLFSRKLFLVEKVVADGFLDSCRKDVLLLPFSAEVLSYCVAVRVIMRKDEYDRRACRSETRWRFARNELVCALLLIEISWWLLHTKILNYCDQVDLIRANLPSRLGPTGQICRCLSAICSICPN